jgi:hypothetical protein
MKLSSEHPSRRRQRDAGAPGQDSTLSAIRAEWRDSTTVRVRPFMPTPE